MGSQHSLLVIALLFASFMIWQVWEQDKNPQPQAQQTTQTTTIATGSAVDQDVPASGQGRLITVKAGVLDLTINTRGGDVEQASLPTYPKELGSTESFQLLKTTPQFAYQAQNGLTGRDGLGNPANSPRPPYDVGKDMFVLADGQNELQIPMVYTDATGNTFTKTFVLKRGKYAVNVSYSVQNAGGKPLEISTFGQLKQSINLPSHRDTGNNSFALHTFRGTTHSTPDEKYEKYKLDTITENENLDVNAKDGWVAILQQYSATAQVPCNDGTNSFYIANLGSGIAAIGYKSQPVLVQFGQTGAMTSTLWVDPEIRDKMAAVTPHLDLTVDYGWLWFISQPLFKLLKWIHGFLGNWGFSIIVITFIARGIMYSLTKAQYTSMAKMHMLQPKIRAMRERLDDDKQHQSREMIALYKTEKVNPLGGCFPLVIQMPVFLALYYMLMGSIELRHAPFALWIRGLSAQDPYYVLPILVGVTMFSIRKVSPTTMTDPMQQKIMTFMPVIFAVFFLWFPSSLMLYCIINSLITIIQQRLIYHGLEKRGLHSRERKNS